MKTRLVYIVGTNDEINQCRLSLHDGRVLTALANYKPVLSKPPTELRRDQHVYGLLVDETKLQVDPNQRDPDNLLLWDGPPGAYAYPGNMIQCEMVSLRTQAAAGSADIDQVKKANDDLMRKVEELHVENRDLRAQIAKGANG